VLLTTFLSNFNTPLLNPQGKKDVLVRIFNLTLDHPLSNLVLSGSSDDLSAVLSELVINLNVLI